MSEEKKNAAELKDADLKQVAGGYINEDNCTGYVIDPRHCNGCGMCEGVCPTGIISKRGDVYEVDLNGNCTVCGACMSVCVQGAVLQAFG